MVDRTLTTRHIIESLAKEYLKDENYTHGFITYEWIDKIAEKLKFKELDDLGLANMWDMVYLTLDSEFNYHRENGNVQMAIKYRDVTSAFTEAVNSEVRRRKEE